MTLDLNNEWSYFLTRCVDTTLPIKLENLLYEKAKNKWYKKMSSKYGFSVHELKKYYGTQV